MRDAQNFGGVGQSPRLNFGQFVRCGFAPSVDSAVRLYLPGGGKFSALPIARTSHSVFVYVGQIQGKNSI